MRRPVCEPSWPEAWKSAYRYDLEEVYGPITNLGYAYAYQCRRDKALSLLSAALHPGARILDVAAAQGNFSLQLAERGYKVTWNDVRAELVDYVRLKYEHGHIEFAPGNAFDLEFETLFDGVLITEIIEHVAHPDRFLQKVAQLVKPGGYVIMTTPNGAYIRNRLPKFSECVDTSVYEAVEFKPDSDGHIFLLHTHEIRELAVTAGLRVDDLCLFTNPLTSGHIKMGAVLRVLPRGIVDGLERGSQCLPAWLAGRLHAQIGVRFQRPLDVSSATCGASVSEPTVGA